MSENHYDTYKQYFFIFQWAYNFFRVSSEATDDDQPGSLRLLDGLEALSTQHLENEKKSHAETIKLLASCRDTNLETHNKNLDLEAQNQSLTRRNDRLLISEKNWESKYQKLQEEFLATKEQFENEKRMHKATKKKLQVLNQRER